MFKAVNPYEEVIAKATDEKQTEVNWDVLLTIWDKVSDDGEAGARNAVAALSKRLQHRSANVQLFSLTLAGALVNNCGPPLHREISGKAFTQTLVRLINDRTTHEDVKKQAIKSIGEWVKEHPKNPDFDLMVDTYESLKKQNVRFDDERPKSPPRRTDDALRQEEEDLQRALAESAALADPRRGFASSSKDLPHSPTETSFEPPAESSAPLRSTSDPAPKRVKALYNFVPQTAEELGFAVGDIIDVLECVYEAWWKGSLRGQVGIFPANHVEPLKDEPVQDEAQMEAELFAQAANVDKLLAMMRGMQGKGENVADNDELIELYGKSMALRPKVVKLIERYEQKQAELHSMNQKFAKAASAYESMVGQRAPAGYASASAPYGQPQPAPGAHGAQPAPGQPQGHGQADPYAGWTEQQRREYDAQWAAYHEQMKAYERAQAEYQAQQAAMQHQGAPPPQGQAQAQGAEEPYWDGSQWVHPQQPPVQGAYPPQEGAQAGGATSPPPQPANGMNPAAAYYHPAQQAHYAQQAQQSAAGGYPAQPYPPQDGLAEQMGALSVNGAPQEQHAPPPQEYYDPSQQPYAPTTSSGAQHATSPPPPPGQASSHIYRAQGQPPYGGHEPQYPAAAQPWGGQQ